MGENSLNMLSNVHEKSYSIWSLMLDEIFSEFPQTFGVQPFDPLELVTAPPDPSMGDISLPCFAFAKQAGKNPVVLASEWAAQLNECPWGTLIARSQAAGPYLNFFFDEYELAKRVLGAFSEVMTAYGTHHIGKRKKYLVEFGCPNPLKVFHLGHLKNLITGESIARILENAGYHVVRVNYQGDVGMHIAKALWALERHQTETKALAEKSHTERMVFFGRIYAEGAKAYEDEASKKEIVAMNKRIYEKDPAIQELYQAAVKWSLEYFDEIYKKLGTGFDRLFMESEIYEPGMLIVKENLVKGIFKESEGAIIYEGSKYGLHDRVFINSEGFPTYEAKDLGLAEAHFNEFDPDRIIHVVGKEQADYFKVVFKAIEEIWPERTGKEYHLPGGFLQLKGSMKMSSRTGNVISGDELLQKVEERVLEVMKDSKKAGNEEVVRIVTDAALTYAMLKAGVSQDVSFNLEESVNISGDSGPYLLYIVARIKSILKKADNKKQITDNISDDYRLPITDYEKQLLLKLAAYPEITNEAAKSLDPSIIARYLFDLAQSFNTFYHECPVLQAEEGVKDFRLELIKKVEQVMTSGLGLLGVATIDEM